MKNEAGQVWCQTVSGVAVDLPTPLPEQIVLSDIAYALAGQNRFNCCSKPYWSVAAHSVLAARLLETAAADASPNLLLACLLHDAHEAYIGDLCSPVKQALEQIDPASMDAWRTLEASVQQVIHTVFDLPRDLSEDWLAAIKRVDMQALWIERITFMAPGERAWGIDQYKVTTWPTKTVSGRSWLRMAKDPKLSMIEFLGAFEYYDEKRGNLTSPGHLA